MREMDADLFHVGCDAIVITTNGFVKKNGEALMGRGVARYAAQKWPQLPLTLGRLLKASGNHVFDAYKPSNQPLIITFPVKTNWMNKADLELIKRSAGELVLLAAQFPNLLRICLPRPGCGNGQLDWYEEVRPILRPILDDRFVIVFPVHYLETFTEIEAPEVDPRTMQIRHVTESISGEVTCT